MERRRDEEGTISLGRGSASVPLDRFLRRWAGNDLGLKGGKPRRLDAGRDRDQLGQKQMLSGRVVTALVRDRSAGEE
jgi:hypothetical protein